MIKIYYHPHFRRRFKKLSSQLQGRAAKRTDLFAEDPFHPSLGTHKLKGKMVEEWAFSVTDSYRIIFTWGEKGEVILADIGTHDEVY